MFTDNSPLVSCLCITHNEVELLKRSVECFANQSYPNKELIVVYTADNVEAAKFMDTLNDQRIVCHEIPRGAAMTLGEKRNLSIEKCNGFYFCVWDDDDWHNPNRVALQVKSLQESGYKCSALCNLLIYDGEAQQGFLSANRAWEQTLLCETALINFDTLRYAHLDKGEDTILLSDLQAKGLVTTLFDPGLYIYTYHGKNTWHRQHWQRNVINRGNELTTGQSGIIKEILNGHYSAQESATFLKEFF